MNPLFGATILFAAFSSPAEEKASWSPPVHLPDGTEFKSWEVPLEFTRTYHVNGSHPKASDENSGTKAEPFKTINRAAQVLQPGERVVVAAGIYRERVRPARGGAGPGAMISYEAAPDAVVVVKGSQVLKEKWSLSSQTGGAGAPTIWKVRLPEDQFPAENPFQEVNLTDEQIDRCMPWAVPVKGSLPNRLRRGLLFQEGKRLKQVAAREELAKAQGTYWVGGDGLTVLCRPFDDRNPNEIRFEVTVRGFIFAPDSYGLGYIRVKGFSVEHSGNRFPRPQEGALSTQRGHHWIIEDNTVQECNAIGIDIGDQFYISGPALVEGGRHIVRRNTITDCGIGGLEGKLIEHTLIEDNVIRRCGWQGALRIWETGGIKVHCTRSCLIRRNLVTDTIQAPGIWMDYANVNSRCTQNIIINIDSPNGGIFMEASQAPNLVDRNFVWGCTGNGIYQHDCDELTMAHNFIAKSKGSAIRMTIMKNRRVGGRLSTAKRNKIMNNIAVDTGSMFSFTDRDNSSDFNLFSPGETPFDLAAWQNEGWDRNSAMKKIQASFDPVTLELTWSVEGRSPDCPPITGITRDFWDRPLGEKENGTVAPGPFGPLPSKPVRIRIEHSGP